MKLTRGLRLRAAFVLLNAFIILPAFANDELKPVLDKSAKINDLSIASQKKIDRLAEEIEDKLREFKSVNKETQGLEVYNQQMDSQIQNQLLEMQKLNESIDKVSVIERQITPLMLRMIEGLQEFVALDVPFLLEERKKRIQSLNDMMSRADVAVSEKFRRVLEAYQVETDYGRTIESYVAPAAMSDTQQDVNYLRVGRVALVYQSRDKQKMAIWNNQSRQWEELGSEYRSQIANGIKMAKKQKAPDMITVPVAAPQTKS